MKLFLKLLLHEQQEKLSVIIHTVSTVLCKGAYADKPAFPPVQGGWRCRPDPTEEFIVWREKSFYGRKA